jgi:hypothetical protein
MHARLRQLVRERAKNCCEYCGLSQEQEPLTFHIEHICAKESETAPPSRHTNGR